jgi:hypothetical protein
VQTFADAAEKAIKRILGAWLSPFCTAALHAPRTERAHASILKRKKDAPSIWEVVRAAS